MNDKEAIERLRHECPRGILGRLHANGHYIHQVSPQDADQVLCYTAGHVPEGELTEAQAHFFPTQDTPEEQQP